MINLGDPRPAARVTLVSNEQFPVGGSQLVYQGTVVYPPQQQVQQTWTNGLPAYQQPSVQHEELQQRQAQVMPPPEVTRYATEKRTAWVFLFRRILGEILHGESVLMQRLCSYNLKSRSGQLYVSAPAGSHEAQLFDEVARRNAKPKVCIPPETKSTSKFGAED